MTVNDMTSRSHITISEHLKILSLPERLNFPCNYQFQAMILKDGSLGITRIIERILI